MRKRIVITGASGSVVGRVLPQLRQEYDLVLLDKYDTNNNGHIVEGVQKVDLINQSRDEYRHFFAGADAVIHAAYSFSHRATGFTKNAGRETDEEDQFKFAVNDVQMAFNIYKVVQEENIKRAIMFSSNQASNYYEQLIKKGVLETITEDMPSYSDNFYGWSKICQETLGHLFAAGVKGKRIEVIMIRAGAPRTDLIEKCTGDDYYVIRRHFGSYMSVNDELQFLRLCIEKEDIRDENGTPFLLCYATSDNPNRFWSLRNARTVLGYKPEDSSYNDFPEKIKQLLVENIDKVK